MAQDIYNRLGHPGKFPKATTVTTGDSYFTGSAGPTNTYGASAIIRGTGAIGSVNLTNGGSISLTDLDAGVIHELSVESVTGIASGSVYVLNRG